MSPILDTNISFSIALYTYVQCSDITQSVAVQNSSP